MKLEGIGIDDVVLIDHKGRRFHASVTGKNRGELEVKPIERSVTWYRVAAHEVIDHWRHVPRMPYNPRARSAPRARPQQELIT